MELPCWQMLVVMGEAVKKISKICLWPYYMHIGISNIHLITYTQVDLISISMFTIYKFVVLTRIVALHAVHPLFVW